MLHFLCVKPHRQTVSIAQPGFGENLHECLLRNHQQKDRSFRVGKKSICNHNYRLDDFFFFFDPGFVTLSGSLVASLRR